MTIAPKVQDNTTPALSLVGGFAPPPQIPTPPPGLPSQDYTDGEIIIKFKSDLGPGLQSFVASGLQSAMQATLAATTQTMGSQLWQIQGMSVAEAIAAYKDHPSIEYIQPNYTIKLEKTTSPAVSPSAIPNDPGLEALWGLNNTGQTGGFFDADIDAPEAWDLSLGTDVVVGVIDSGVDYTHPDLDDNLWFNTGEIFGNGIDDDGNGYIDDAIGYDFINNDADPYDDEGHGTHVAGTIAAEANNGIGVVGVAPEAKIMALKIFDANGNTNSFAAIRAIEYATMMGADITNNSWGGGPYNQALYDAIAAAGQAGQVFVASAGNGGADSIGDNNDLFPHYPDSYDLDNIVSVAASNHIDQFGVFSNYGPTSVDLLAPGVDIWSTVPGGGYQALNGTSMAAPHVAGAAALILAQDPSLSPAEVRARLLDTVDPIASAQGWVVSGGRLNAFNALNADLTGDIYGSQWHDLDGDKVWDSDELGLAGWQVYLDANQNGELDLGEQSTITDSAGNYAFLGLAPDTYMVASVLQPDWEQTYPMGIAPTSNPTFLPGQSVMLRADPTNAFTQVAPSSQTQSALLNNVQTADINVTYNGFTPEAQAAFEYAVDIWETQISSTVPIEVNATWETLGQGVLGSAGPVNAAKNFENAPLAETYYPIAIANKLANTDIDPSQPDISARFNQEFGNWYFGTDGQTPAGKYDFVSVVLHELGHGLGFVGGMSYDTATGLGSSAFSDGIPIVYSRNVMNGFGQSITDFPVPSVALGQQLVSDNLFFIGENAVEANNGLAPKLYAPNNWESGSSFSHLDEVTYGAGDPNSLMTPQIGMAEAIHDPGAIARGMFEDMGWTLVPAANAPGTHTVTLNPGDVVTGINFGNRIIPTNSGPNFSFETGDFSGWQVQGDGSVDTSAIGVNPMDGTYQALITTSAANGAVSAANVATFLDLAPNALNIFGNGAAIEGSALKLDPLTVNAGDVLTFDWNFLTDEVTPSPNFNDFGFVALSNGFKTELTDTFGSFTSLAGGAFNQHSGYGTYRYVFNDAGTYTLGIGVVDARDGGGDSGLLIDNLQVTPLADPALNLGFETGDFTDWTAQGNAQIETAAWGINPTEGTYQALITTGDGAVTDAQLEEQLRLAAGTLDLLGNGDVVEGSMLQLTPMTVEAGDILTVDWNYLTDETANSPVYNDFGFMTINTGLTTKLADTYSSLVSFNTSSFDQQTGYNTFTYEFTEAGVVSLALGIAGVQDGSVDSGLLIDNVVLNAIRNRATGDGRATSQPRSTVGNGLNSLAGGVPGDTTTPPALFSDPQFSGPQTADPQPAPLAELWDLTGFDSRVEASLTLAREAAFDNLLQFYQTDAQGGITWNGQRLLPGEAGYETAVADLLIDDPILRVGNREVSDRTITLAGGSYYAPAMAIDGDYNNLATIDDAFTSLGRIERDGNVWRFEDLTDFDFNDLVVTVNATEAVI